MNIMKQIWIPIALLAVSSTSWACGSGGGCRSGCGGGTTPDPDPSCVVTWDFTNNGSRNEGDPINPTYTGVVHGDSTATYNLKISGFTVKAGYSQTSNGKLFDGEAIYAMDVEGNHGIGVHAAGEDADSFSFPDHWGTKIDNYKNTSGNDNEMYQVRDAVLLDFQNCVVSIDEIGLEAISDTDFELWAYKGADIDYGQSLVAQLNGDYDNWTGANSADWMLVESNWNYNIPGDRVASISNKVSSQYFVLIAGGNQSDYGNDAFRMSNLQVTCDPGKCGGGDDGEAPIPGTLALLGIGALATRRRFFKLS